MRLPLVTATLVFLNLFAYQAELANGGLIVCEQYGLIPAHPTLGAMLTALFLHDPTSLWHLGGNMLCLVMFGFAVERVLGSVRFTLLYFAAGILGALFHVAVNPASTDPLVGASGAIFGVLAVSAVLYPRTIGFVASYAAFNVACLLIGVGGPVSFGDHVGGFVAGFLFLAITRPTRNLSAA